MTETTISPRASVLYCTALADSVLAALPREAQAVAALEIKGHVRELEARLNVCEPGGCEDETQARALLQTFFDRMVQNRAA